MTDKVQKIREEVARIQLYTQSEVLKQILDYIDSLQEEPVSEDFEKALANEWKGYIDRGAATVDALEDNTQELTFAKGFYRGAKWQKEKEYTCYEEAFEDGASWKKEEMMANAIETTVHIDAGGYPYIPQIELYDYDKDVPLAKEGDKYKVILIKED